MTIITILSIITSILVISSSTVFSVLWLTGTFMIISLMLGLLNLGFPALIYVIVYIGAIAILFLFVIQLLDTGKTNNINIYKQQDSSYSILGSALSIVMISIATVISNSFNIIDNNRLIDIVKESFNVEQLTNQIGVSAHVDSLAEWLYGPGLLPLIIISVVLLVAMIAPIYLCNNR